MIHKLTIQNFQSHPATQLDLVPGVNCIVGRSDSGKSAVLRALIWLVTNRPSGESFRSNWGGDTEVTVTLDEERLIRRLKGDKDNEYAIGPRKFKAMGRDVPEDVVKLLNLSDINIQAQHNAPFLLSESSGEVARKLNEIANLEGIDRATININRMVRANEQETQTAKTRQQTLEQELLKFEMLDDIAEAVQGYRLMDVQRQKVTKMADDLSRLSSDARRLHGVLNHMVDVDGLQESLQRVLDASKQQADLKTRAQELRVLLGKLEASQRVLDRTEQVPGLIDAVEALSSRYGEGREVRAQLDDLRGLVERRETKHRAVWRLEQEVSGLDLEFHALMPDECPLCGK